MNILIVEDDPMVGQINQRFARKLSFVEEVDVVTSPEQAKENLEEKEYDLLLLDVYFPSGRGPDLLQWIRNRELPLQVIFITADNSQKTVERAMHLGALDYLVKPFTFGRFKSAVEGADRHILSLKEQGEFSQEMLDQVFQGKGEKDTAETEEESFSFELDKGMSYKTYELVKKRISRMEGYFTAEQLGEQLGIARVTIRRYLDFMEKQDILEVRLQYGKIGRPQHHYKVKEKT